MTHSPLSLTGRLRQMLTSRYAEFRRQLEYIVGNKEDAADALQETWVRLDGLSANTRVSNPDAYLLRMAVNIATDAFRRESRHAGHVRIDETFDVPDETPGPERAVRVRVEAQLLLQSMRALPERQQAILVAARVDGLMNQQIAQRLGISESLVEKELRHALKHCRQAMQAVVDIPASSVRGRRKG